MLSKSCKKMLVRGVNWIGDSVMSLSALRVLRKALPETKISILVKPWVSPIYENNPNVDEIIIYNDEYKSIIGKIKLSWMLNKKDFCSAILFQNAFDAALITFLARIKERAGYSTDSRGFLLTETIPVPHNAGNVHQVNYYLNLLEQIGIKEAYSDPYIYLTLDERLHARTLLKDMRRPVLGINPGATYGSAKRWFPERFAEIANWFIRDTKGSVIIFGGKNEEDIAQEINNLVISQQSLVSSQEFAILHPEPKINSLLITHNSLLNLAGKTSLRELISVISECDVFVTNDSGPLHIAYAVGTPLVALFCSTDPKLTGPLPETDGEGNVVIHPDISCSPCFERTCKSNDLKCMYAITSDDVYFGVKKILPVNPAVFFDRDGTLCKDVGYLNKYDDFHPFLDIESVTSLKERGFKLIGVSNQSGIAKGIIEEDFVRYINTIFIEKYNFDDFYYCPHQPEERCPCRKPEPQMLLKARAKHGIDFKKSFIVGDKEADMLLAKAVGAKGILVKTGVAKESAYADFIAENLTGAVNWIVKSQESLV